MSAADSHAGTLRGVPSLLAATLIFSVVDALAKYLGQFYPVSEVIWARYMVHFVVIALLLPVMRMRFLHTRNLGVQILRSLLLVATTIFTFIAVQYLPLTDVGAIAFTRPFIATALAAIALGEQVGQRRWGTLVAGFAGAVIMLRPDAASFQWASLLPLGTAICFAVAQILTRWLGGADNMVTTLFYTGAVGPLVVLIGLPLPRSLPSSLAHGELFLAMGLLAVIGHLALIHAYRHSPASVLAPFGYAQLFWLASIGFVIFRSLPDLTSIVGMSIIAASGLYNGYLERRGPAASAGDATRPGAGARRTGIG